MGEEGELEGEVSRDVPLRIRDRGRLAKRALYPLREAVDLRARRAPRVQRVLQLPEVVEDDPEHRLQRGHALATGLRLAPDRRRQGDSKAELRAVGSGTAPRPRLLSAARPALTRSRRALAARAGGRLTATVARAGEAAQRRCRIGVGSRVGAEPPASPRRLRAGEQPACRTRLPGISTLAAAPRLARRGHPSGAPARRPGRARASRPPAEPRVRLPGPSRNDAPRHRTRAGPRTLRREIAQNSLAARAPAVAPRRLVQRGVGAAEAAGAAVVQRELGQRRGGFASTARAVLRSHPRRAARRFGEREHRGDEVPVKDPDTVLAQDRHRQVELGDVVDVDPQARLPFLAEAREPGAEPAVLAEQVPAGPDRPRVELAHEAPVQLQDGEEIGVEHPVEGRGLVVVQAGRRRCREAVQHQRGAELVAHDRRHLVGLLGVALLALHPGRDGHHDHDDEHRHPVREDVHERHAREVGHAPGPADGGGADHGPRSAYSRM